MLITLFNFNKRENSTKRPAINDQTAKNINCQIKDECDLLNPILLVSPEMMTGTFSPNAYNYVSIPFWERFYFIKNWNYKKPIWECQLSVDVLASYKTQIGNTSAYIERASGAFDGSIIDNYYPAKNTYTIQKTNVACAWYGVAPSGGSYILGCINQDTNHIGSVSYYALTQSQLNSVLVFLYGDSIYNNSSISEIGSGLYKSMFNPFQYIVSCLWFPFSTAAFGSAQSEVKVGYWGTGVQGIVVSNLAEKTYVTATIPSHPQTGARGTYLNYAPFTQHTLYIPPFGEVPINTSFKAVGNYLYSAVYVDHLTGEATLRISTCQNANNLDEYNVQSQRTAVLGVPIQIAQVMVNATKGISSIGGAVGSLLSLNLGGLFNSIGNALESQMPQVASQGANGSFTSFIMAPELISKFISVTDANNTEFGRPLCQTRTINTLPGYIKTGEADHAFNALSYERTLINQFMKNGFFYE